MKVLLTGASGQLGQAFRERAAGRLDIVPLYHQPGPDGLHADLADVEALADAVARTRPDWVVHGAALTDVDRCEREPALAEAINGRATGALAAAARDAGSRMLYVSTDYVYDGLKGNYRETDATGPINAYGRTKLEGERLARDALPDVLIARTAVVFGPHKNNFVLWALREMRAGRPVRVVADQRVTPTLAFDLADQLVALLDAGERGIFHTAGASQLQRVEMAREMADVFGLDPALITTVDASQLPWVAKRPLDSTLDVSKVSRVRRPLTFRQALEAMKERIA